jgi:hypothetical protein
MAGMSLMPGKYCFFHFAPIEFLLKIDRDSRLSHRGGGVYGLIHPNPKAYCCHGGVGMFSKLFGSRTRSARGSHNLFLQIARRVVSPKRFDLLRSTGHVRQSLGWLVPSFFSSFRRCAQAAP